MQILGIFLAKNLHSKKFFTIFAQNFKSYIIMAQLHNGNLHCLRRNGRNGKQIALYVTKNDVPRIYVVHIYKRIKPDELMMKLDMEFVFDTYCDAKNKYNEYNAHL